MTIAPMGISTTERQNRMTKYYAEPDHEDEEEMEDPGIDDHMDPGIRIKRQPHEEDEAPVEIPWDEEPDVVDHGET